MQHGRVLLVDSHLGVLGGVHGLLDGMFQTVLMVADEQSLADAVTTFKPELVVVYLSLPRGGEAIVADELQSQALKGQHDGGEGSGHHRTFFIGPGEFERVRAKLFERAIWIAGDAEGLDGFVILQQFGGAQDFGGFAGARH